MTVTASFFSPYQFWNARVLIVCGLLGVRLLRPVLEDLVEEQTALRDVDDLGQAATGVASIARSSRASMLALGDPALVPARAGLVAFGVIAGELREGRAARRSA